MKTRAAVLTELGKPLEILDLEIPPLQPGQTLVKIEYSGVCHTQLLEARGRRGSDPYVPHCLGHEASGVVVEIGQGVTKVASGDSVILSWIKGSGADVPGTQYRWGERTVNSGGVTTFSELAVVSENRLTVAPAELSRRRASLIGCAAPTGVGAVWHGAELESGQNVAVLGVGGVGLCAVAAAADRGAGAIIAVDINPARLELARQLGATETFDATQSDVLSAIRDITNGGVDHAIEASGRPAVMQLALECLRPRGGKAIIIGNAHHGELLSIDPKQLNQGKRLIGVWGGDCEPDRDFVAIAQRMEDGRLPLDCLLGATYSLEQVNEALDDLESASVARPLLQLSDA